MTLVRRAVASIAALQAGLAGCAAPPPDLPPDPPDRPVAAMSCTALAAEFEANGRALRILADENGRRESGVAAASILLGATFGIGLGQSVRLQNRIDAYAARRDALVAEGVERGCEPPG